MSEDARGPRRRTAVFAAAAGAALVLAAGCGTDGLPAGPGDGDGPGDGAPPEAWAAVAAGDGFSCAVAEDGRLFCWGSRRLGRLGDGDLDGSSSRPGRVSTDLRMDTVVAGPGHACGLATDGAAVCWGRNDRGQLGTTTGRRCPTEGGSVACGPVPVRAATPLQFRSIAVGGSHTCGITVDGILFCWGDNGAGQLGVGQFGGGGPTPLAVIRGAAEVDAGELHTCALALGTEVLCWGGNGDGQLGDRTFVPRTAPVVATARGASALTAGSRHACVLAPAHCWGRGTEGQLGDGQARTAPFLVRVETDRTFRLLDAGGFHTCGVSTRDEALCWGRGEGGALGTGRTPELRTVPVPVAGDRGWRSVSAGRGHTCGIDTDGELWCWGRNVVGQLGDGTDVDRPAPAAVADPAG